MSSPKIPPPQVVVRGKALLVVDPEIADVDVTVRVRARDRQTALERCSTRQEEVAAVVAGAGDAVEVIETTGGSVYLEGRDRRAPWRPGGPPPNPAPLGGVGAPRGLGGSAG